ELAEGDRIRRRRGRGGGRRRTRRPAPTLGAAGRRVQNGDDGGDADASRDTRHGEASLIGATKRPPTGRPGKRPLRGAGGYSSEECLEHPVGPPAAAAGERLERQGV